MISGLARHLARISIARVRKPLDHPSMQELAAFLPRLGQLAEGSPGFVWRLAAEEQIATAPAVFDDPLILADLTLWKNLESLRDYVSRADHAIPFRERQAWFEPAPEPHAALWWVPTGDRPGLQDGRIRLDQVGRLGPTADAFTLARPFTPAGEPREPESFDRPGGD